MQGAYLGLINGVRTLGALTAGAIGTWIGLRPALWLAVIGGVASVIPLLRPSIITMRALPSQVEYVTD